MSSALAHAVCLALLWLLFVATGRSIEAVARPLLVPSLGPGLVRFATGALAWIYLLFGLASVGAYRAGIVLPLAALVLAAALPWLLHRGRATLAPALSGATTPLGHGYATLIALALPPSLALALSFARALAPNVGWDDDVYHLTLPKLYLAHGGFLALPGNAYASWPHGVELLYGLAMMLDDYVLAKLVHWLWLVAASVAIYRVCRPHASRALSLWAASLLPMNPVVLYEAERAYVDLAFAFFLLCAVESTIHHLRQREQGALWLAAICCGGLMGIKLSGFIGLGCVLALILCMAPRRRPSLRTLSVLFGVAALCALPWYMKSYVQTGNPVYPLLFDLFGGELWSAELSAQFIAWQREIGMGRSAFDYLALPVRVVLNGGQGYEHFDGELAHGWILIVPVVCASALCVRGARPYLLASALYFVFWASSSQQVRFLIPVLPLLAVATGITVSASVQTARWRAFSRTGRVVPLCVGVACAAFITATLPHLRNQDDPGSSPVPEGYAFVNAQLPAHAKLLLINTNRAFFLERAYIADSFFEASQVSLLFAEAGSRDALARHLTALGLTHLYVASDDMGVQYPARLTEWLEDPARTRAIYRCADGSCVIYEIQRS